MFEDFINEKTSKAAEKLAESRVLPLEEKIDDLTSGIEIITDVVSEIPSRIEKEISPIKEDISLLKKKVAEVKTIKGKDGKDGIDGLDGDDGQPGKDGSPDTPLEIKAKLISLSEEDKIKLEDFGGFENLLTKIDSVAKKNGNNPIPYSGITTTFFSLNGADKGRAKNINFTTGSSLNVTLSGDTATITIPTGGGGSGVQSVTDDSNGVVVVNNTNPLNPIVGFNGVNVDGTTILGDGTLLDPLHAALFGNLNFFLTDTGSDIGGVYLDMVSTNPGGSQVDLATIGVVDSQLVQVWATVSGEPNLTELFEGISNLHVLASKANPGGQDVQIYFEVYSRDTGGTETLVSTSAPSNFLTTTPTKIAPADLNPDTIIANTDRLVVKTYTRVTGTGSAPDITISILDNTLSRFSIPGNVTNPVISGTPTEILYYDATTGVRTSDAGFYRDTISGITSINVLTGGTQNNAVTVGGGNVIVESTDSVSNDRGELYTADIFAYLQQFDGSNNYIRGINLNKTTGFTISNHDGITQTTWLFPDVDSTGTQALVSDGSGVLSWADIPPFPSGGNTLIGQTSGIISNPAGLGTFETWLGELAGNGVTSSVAFNSTFLGYQSGDTATGAYDSVFVGDNAGALATDAHDSVFLGEYTGWSAFNADNSIFIGNATGEQAENADNSIFMGTGSGSNATNANNSIFIGESSGFHDSVDNSGGSYSILIGANTSTDGNIDSVAIGTGAVNTLANQFLVSSPTAPFTDVSIESLGDWSIGDYNGGANNVKLLGDNSSATIVGHVNIYDLFTLNGIGAFANWGDMTTNSNVLVSATTGLTIVGDVYGNGFNTKTIWDDGTQIVTTTADNGIQEVMPQYAGDVTRIHMKVSLTAAQIQNANSVPIDIGLPASGVGFYYRVTKFDCKLNYGTTPFTSTQLSIFSNSGATVQYLNGIPPFTTSEINLGTSQATLAISAVENDTISIGADSDSVTGDSTVDCYITVEKVAL